MADINFLRSMEVKSALFFQAEFSAPWRLRAAESAKLANFLDVSCDRLFLFHLVLSGQATLRSGDHQQILGTGDIFVSLDGEEHELYSGSTTQVLDSGALLSTSTLGQRLRVVHRGGGGDPTRFVCGFVAGSTLWSEGLLAGLPGWFVVSFAPEEPWFASVLVALANEGPPAPVAARFAEGLFLGAISRFREQGGAAESRRSPGDPVVQRVLNLFHQDPSRDWTVVSIASEAGASRSVLSARFKERLGLSPMAYLTQLRLTLGARRLLQSPLRTVVEVAYSVGYRSEASFNRAFRRFYGLPPGRYRQTPQD